MNNNSKEILRKITFIALMVFALPLYIAIHLAQHLGGKIIKELKVPKEKDNA